MIGFRERREREIHFPFPLLWELWITLCDNTNRIEINSVGSCSSYHTSYASCPTRII
jgi:hypothetical protein